MEHTSSNKGAGESQNRPTQGSGPSRPQSSSPSGGFRGPRPPMSGPRPSGPRGPRDREPMPEKQRKNRINEEIRVPEVRVVDEEGVMLGVMQTREAIELAYEREKDLVEIAQQAVPPVCKIIDYGKFAYEQQKREKLAKKAQHHAQFKVVRFKWRTDTHDFDFKTRHAREFLGEGHKVKATVMFKGREIMHQEIGLALLERFVAALEDCSRIDQPIHPEGRTLSVILAPDKVGKKPKKEKSSDEE
ncbi:MAG: translation initiation factor IF-3 [Ignavibacteria bacterium]